MSKARYLPKRDYEALKAVSRDLAEAAGGSKRVCELTRACPSRLSEALAPQCEDRFLAIDQVADMEADVGSPVITKLLADMLGCDVVPRETKPSSRSLRAIVAQGMKETTEVFTAFTENESNVEALVNEIDEALAIMDEMRSKAMEARAAALGRHTLRAVG